MDIVTFNLRCVYRGVDGINSFIHRAGMVFDVLDKRRPAVVAFQEVKAEHLRFLRLTLGEIYEFYGSGRDADYGGEGLYTAVRRDLLEVKGYDLFWISPTPGVPGSRFEEQSPCPRICVSLTLRRRDTGECFRVYNIHLDHVSDTARRLGLTAVLDRIAADHRAAPLPVVLLGDFNLKDDSTVLSLIDAHRAPALTDATRGLSSFHGFGKRDPAIKIDYIYLSDPLIGRVMNACAWEDREDGIYLSDHYPIAVTLGDPEPKE